MAAFELEEAKEGASGERPTAAPADVAARGGLAAGEAVPAMPTQTPNVAHRPKDEEYPLPFSALVARPVAKREVEENSAARQAVLKEWDKLRAAKCWDEAAVQEWSDVADKARRSGEKAHVGRIFEICVEKGSELPAGDPG